MTASTTTRETATDRPTDNHDMNTFRINALHDYNLTCYIINPRSATFEMTSESEPNTSLPFSPIQQTLPATPSRSTSQVSMVSAEALLSHSSPTKQLTPSHRSSLPSALPYNTLLNAPAGSPALRARASTASSSRAPSVLDDARVEHNDSETQVLEITPPMDNYELDGGSDHTSLPSDASSIKGKEKQRSNDRNEIETVGAGGEMALPSGDARKGLKELVRRSTTADKGYGGHDHRRLSEKLSQSMSRPWPSFIVCG